MLKLMYITNDPSTALAAQAAGVDRIFVDLETVGKALRQGGMDTVQSHHTISDIHALRSVVTSSELLVRVNPIYPGSLEEIDAVITAGADRLMLPFFQTSEQVETFLQAVNGRARTTLLFETPESITHLDTILSLPGIDECFIGLNDLHLGYAIVSGWMECFDENGTYGLVRYRECPSLENFLRGSQFCHASSMIRKDAILSIGGYRTTPSVHRVEDYDLWIRMYEQGFRGYNLQQVLYQMRDDRNAVNRRKFRYRWNESKLSWHIFRTLQRCTKGT